MNYKIKIWIFIMLVTVLTRTCVLLDYIKHWNTTPVLGFIIGFLAFMIGNEIDKRLERCENDLFL